MSFTRAPAPPQQQVEALLLDVHARVMRLLARRGLLEADVEDALACDAPAHERGHDHRRGQDGHGMVKAFTPQVLIARS